MNQGAARQADHRLASRQPFTLFMIALPLPASCCYSLKVVPKEEQKVRELMGCQRRLGQVMGAGGGVETGTLCLYIRWLQLTLDLEKDVLELPPTPLPLKDRPLPFTPQPRAVPPPIKPPPTLLKDFPPPEAIPPDQQMFQRQMTALIEIIFKKIQFLNMYSRIAVYCREYVFFSNAHQRWSGRGWWHLNCQMRVCREVENTRAGCKIS